MKKLLFLWAVAMASAFGSYAQEICDNGIDDDFDGFVDCYDPDCASHNWCEGFYIGGDVLCEAVPNAFPKFTMTLDFASPNETTNHIGRMAIGDLDKDGIPEIATMNRYTKKLIVLNGDDGSIKEEVTVGFTPLWEIAIGNIDEDNCAEIFYQGIEGSSLYMYAYDCELNQIWRTKIRDRNGNLGEALDGINYGLADFDGDGLIELYVKDMILDAHTGNIIINTNTTDDATWNKLNGGPVAVDIMGNANLELVMGLSIYDVNLGARTTNSGTLTLLKSYGGYAVKYPYNATSVADFNLDGNLDVVASGATGSGTNGDPYKTTIFFWDVTNDFVDTFFDNTAGAYLPNGWKNGTGRVNIADLDGDGSLDLSYVSGKFLYAIDENLDLLWRININEETSGFTGCTLFDFNGDGKSEIVYRDERFLYIINGTDGTIFSQQPCISRTQREYPIVADVDADGSTELCVTCGFNDQDAADNFSNLSYSQYSHVRIFKSNAEPWVPARRVWNQHGYFNVNVNDDLSIPRRQQKHHLVWSVGNCTVGPNRPLNTFLNQSPFLNSQGCPTYAAPNLAYVDNSLTVNPPTCPDGDFTVSFQIQNLGDIGLSGDVPITFYQDDPLQAGATKLNTIVVPLNNFEVGQVMAVNNVTVNGPGSSFVLYIVLNDGGTTVPTPIVLPNTNFVECDYTDNVISSPITPLPVTITAQKIQDNFKCVGSTSPDNGAVGAYVNLNGGQNTADFNFYWSIGTTAKPVASADYVGSSYTGLPMGTYTVYAIHKTASCNSDTAQVVVDEIPSSLTVEIIEDNPYTQCKNPNGKLRAVVNGGEPVGKFTYVWYEGNDIFTSPQIGVSHVAADLKPITYTVVVTEKATGCQTIESYTIPDQTVKPVADIVEEDLDCSDPNSGSLTATVAGVTAGYNFMWYNGNTVKPSADYTGTNYANLSAGSYTLVVEDNSTKCTSDPVTVTLAQKVPPVVTASAIAAQTSCDMTAYNGAASATVGGVTTGYAFEWFAGQNTLASNLFASTNAVSNLAAGVYTVRATDNATGCSDTDEVTILNQPITPALSVAAVGSSTNCSTPNGSVTVNVAPDSPDDYTFYWYEGDAVKASPDFADTDNVLDGIPFGEYTVRAVHNTKMCNAAPVTAEVTDGSAPVAVALDPMLTQLPSFCNANDGTATVSISAPGNVGGFNVEWYAGHTPFSAPAFLSQSSVTSTTASGLEAGLYSLVIVNRDNGCQTIETVNVPFANAHSLEFIAKADVLKCNPTDIGQITFELIPTAEVSFDEGDYEIHLYSGSEDLGMPIGSITGGQLLQVINGVAGTSNYNTNNNLTPGFYTLAAISNNPLTQDCRSVPLVVEIEQLVSDPIVTATQIDANMNCEGVDGTGQIELDIDNGAAPTDYAIQWFEGPDTSAPALGTGTSGTTSANNSIAENLPAGLYTVEVTNITATATGCVTVATFQIFDSPPVITIASADLQITDRVLCNLNDAGAEVLNVSENGNPVGIANYTFTWFDASMNPIGATSTIANLSVGTNYVQATSTLSNCATAMIEFQILDMRMNTVGVDLISFVEPTQCLKPANLQGELAVLGTGTSTSGYSYNWYAGPAVAGAPVGNTGTLNGIVIPPGNTDITFTVQVTNNDNNCQVEDTYVLPLIVEPVLLSASSSPLTSCDIDDGVVFATVTTSGSNEYNYSWYIGAAVKPATDFPAVVQPAKEITGLPAGDYTVVAVDQLDAACETLPATVTIENGQVYPEIVVMGMAPVSNCDPARPNGVASASVNGNVADYRFEWFEGTDTMVPPVYTGAEAGGLRAMIYTVMATDLVSGCSSTAQITIMEQLAMNPVVQVEVLSNVTSCVADNGMLFASVEGNTADYIFDWYIGTSVAATPDFTGEYFTDLAVGFYTVTATSKITGCVSAPVTAEIIEDLAYPDFDFGVESASCENNDGYVTLFLSTDVEIETIEWNNNGVITTGPNLSNIPAGTYSVTVTSALGCSTTKEVQILSEIHPFNGISRNSSPGANDLFYIDCISDFPSNIVRIFNRAGTLVYEAEGYDNIDVFFDGRANKGMIVTGNNLPDGTYFYVIDKRNGSKPLAGYLEIIN